MWTGGKVSRALTCLRRPLTHAAVRRIDLCRVAVLGMVLVGAGCSPRGPEALRRGDEALAAGRITEAISLLQQAVTDLPGNAAAWNQLGLAYHAAGRDAEAQKAYLRALNDDRNFFDAHFNLGSLRFEQGQWVEAERSLRTYLGVEGNRTNVAAWRLLGDSLLGSRQLDSAERALNTAAQLAPNEAAIQNSLGLALVAKKRLRDAQARFLQAVRLDPRDPGARLNLAIVTQQLGDRRGALEHYQTYLAFTPPPAGAARVAELARQIELQLAPPPALATNRVPIAAVPPPSQPTNPPPPSPAAPTVRVATNLASVPPVTRPAPTVAPMAPVVAPAAATNPPPRIPPVAPPVATIASNPPPVRTSAPPIVPPITPTVTLPVPSLDDPVEIVRVEDGPELRRARDPVPAVQPPTRTPPSPISPTVSPTNKAPLVVTPPAGTAVASAKKDPVAPAEAAGRKNFWQKVNPVNWGNPVKWFRGSESEEPSEASPVRTPGPADSAALASTDRAIPPSRATVVAPVTPAPVARVAPPVEPPAKPVIPRYARRMTTPLTSGDRTAAQAQAQQAESVTDRELALAAWQRTVQLDPSWTAAWLQTGRVALETSNVGVALLSGEAATTLDPASAPAHQLFAAALARSGFSRDAAEELERAVSLSKGNAAAHLALAGLYARDLGDSARARPHYEMVLKLDPKNSQAGAIRVWLASNP